MNIQFLHPNEIVYFEIRNILLKVREYKKSQSIPITSQFSKVYQLVIRSDLQYNVSQLLEQFLGLQETDEFIQIAFITFYSKLFSCCHNEQINDWLTSELIVRIFDSIFKIDTQYQPVYYEKRLKLVRNAFELPLDFLNIEVIQKMWSIIKQTENHQNLLVKELARDLMSQSLKRMINSHWNELEGEAIQFILKELVSDVETQVSLYTQDPAKNFEAVRLIEYPFSIIQFIIRKYAKNPTNLVFKQFILEDVMFVLNKMSQLDHQVIINQVLDSFKYLIEMTTTNQFEDVLETRTLFGQIILRQLQRQTKKLSSLNLIEQGGIFLSELDVALFLNFLKAFFSQPKVVLHVFEKCDFNPIQTPLFNQLLQGIFELSRVSRRLISEESRVIQSSIQDLLVIIFKCSQLKRPNSDSIAKKEYNIVKQKIHEFITVFNGDPETMGPRVAIQKIKLDSQESQKNFVQFIKQCSLLFEHLTVEILGYHKDKYIHIMEKYVSSFNFKGLSVVEGLRLLLSNFLLFGEAQMIERVLNQFTITYVDQNSDSPLFKNSDSTYTFTYALILLNTDLYNKTVIKRMTQEDFIRQCQKINAGENLPDQYVRDSYNSIQNDPLKCIRDFANSEHLTKFVWLKYLEHKNEVQQALKESLSLFGTIDLESIKLECLEEELGDLMLHQMTNNIEQMVVQYGQDGLEDLTNFLQNVLQICIDNDKMENAQTILSCMYNQVFNKNKIDNKPLKTISNGLDSPSLNIVNADLHIHLYTCFVISKFMLPYLTFQENYKIPYIEEDFSTVILLIRNTILFRNCLLTESLANDCRKILIKIKTNNKFNKKNLGTNSGIFSLFQRFMQEEDHDDEESDDDNLKDLQDLGVLPLTGIREPQLLLQIITQTKYLNPTSLNGFLNQLLGQICSLNNLDQEVVQFSQILHLAVEVLRVNNYRIVQFWPQVSAILSLNYQENRISLQREGIITPPVEHLIKMEFKKRRNRRLIDGFCKFTLLKLSIEVIHIGESLGDFEWCFQEGLSYLQGQSLEILVEFLSEIASYVRTNKLEGARFESLRKSYLLLISIYCVLEKRTLDKNDAKIIFDQSKECFEDLVIKSHAEQDTFHILKEQLRFMEKLVAQKDIAKLSDDFQVKNLIFMLTNYDTHIQTEVHTVSPQESNDFLLGVLNLACGISKDHIQKVLILVQKVSLNYTYQLINEEQFRNLFDKISSMQTTVLQSKSEIIINNYTQIKQRIFSNWIDEKKFSLVLWLDVLKNMMDVILYCRQNKYQTLLDILQVQLRSLVHNPHFENVVDKQSTSKEIRDKTIQLFKQYSIQYEEQKSPIDTSPGLIQKQQSQSPSNQETIDL